MAVTVDVATENVRTLTTSPQTFSHAGAASGVKGFVLTLVHGTSSTDHVTAASYGGVALARKQRNVDTSTEPGAAEIWFLGSGVPQGTQTVSYTPGATTDDFHAVATTLLGDADLEVVDQDGISENVANPSVTLQYGGRTCMAFAVLYGGGAAPSSFTPNANCTTVHDHDLGAFYSEVIRQTTADSSDFAIGGTASSDDVAFAAIAVSEIVTVLSVNVNDSIITVSEDSSVVLTRLVLDVEDSTGISESVLMNLLNMPSVSDALTVSETSSLDLVAHLSVDQFDAVTILESETVEVVAGVADLSIDLFEDVILSESNSASIVEASVSGITYELCTMLVG